VVNNLYYRKYRKKYKRSRFCCEGIQFNRIRQHVEHMVSEGEEDLVTNLVEDTDDVPSIGESTILFNGDLNMTMSEQGNFLFLLCPPCIALEIFNVRSI
jgi:hypothetical protein